jgi:hypothetical protein
MTRSLKQAENLGIPGNRRSGDVVRACLSPARQTDVVKNAHNIIAFLETDNVERLMGA